MAVILNYNPTILSAGISINCVTFHSGLFTYSANGCVAIIKRLHRIAAPRVRCFNKTEFIFRQEEMSVCQINYLNYEHS